MTGPRIIIFIVAVFAVIVLVLAMFQNESVSKWFRYEWLDLFYAFIAAIIAGLLIEFLYRRYSSKSRILQTTMTPPSESSKFMAKLVLKENQEILIKEYERTFGRTDFIEIAPTDDLLFIGKEHFQITRDDYCFYIEDLNTKNGTSLNGEDISGQGKRKLTDGDEILVAKTLDIKYFEEKE
ncbi:MAG: FHA domain-containing protein [Methanobacteriaceae archaeon]|nr:FHA domain-containing protein [Methanobacteriaceae archaeon]